MPRPQSLRLPLSRLVALLVALLWVASASAHPLPISSLDLHYRERGIDGRLVVHMRDLAPELGIGSTDAAADPTSFLARTTDIDRLLGERLLIGGERPIWARPVASPDDPDALQLELSIPGAPPRELAIAAALFPENPEHRTFVNVYEAGELRQQWLLGAGDGPVTYYAGSTAGVLAAAGDFLGLGVQHILVGPDHVLFVIGLILLGGAWRRLVLIVTAFTIGHSVTLSLAALGLFVVPARFVEPAIALSIVVVGVDNLLRGEGRDIRAALAFVFGLVHGFGFAYVLRDLGLPEAHRAAALLAFNLGVQLGQIAIVLLAGTLLALLRRRSPAAAHSVASAGSLAVIAAGGYWFVDRVFLSGSG